MKKSRRSRAVKGSRKARARGKSDRSELTRKPAKREDTATRLIRMFGEQKRVEAALGYATTSRLLIDEALTQLSQVPDPSHTVRMRLSEARDLLINVLPALEQERVDLRDFFPSPTPKKKARSKLEQLVDAYLDSHEAAVRTGAEWQLAKKHGESERKVATKLDAFAAAHRARAVAFRVLQKARGRR